MQWHIVIGDYYFYALTGQRVNSARRKLCTLYYFFSHVMYILCTAVCIKYAQVKSSEHFTRYADYFVYQ